MKSFYIFFKRREIEREREKLVLFVGGYKWRKKMKEKEGRE